MTHFTPPASRLRAALALTAALLAQGAALALTPVQHWTQAGGARVYLVESPGIPMLDVQIEFDAGSRRDPPAQAGLASVSAGMTSKGLRAAGGAPALDENALSEAWTDLGASFGASAGTDRLSFSLRTLTYPDLLPKAAALAARQLAEPAFPAVVWQRERERMVAALKESYTKPSNLASRAFAAAVYGAHPYGYETSAETLARISVADMQRFHASHVLACNARVSLVGAVDRAQADALVQTLLSRLPRRDCKPLPPLPPVPALARGVEQVIPFDSAQAHVFIGQPGVARDHPDYFALIVGNYILGGGGFVSRLSNEVREKRGLSYSVYSYFAPGLHAGAFTVGLQTRPDQARQAVAVAREVVARFVADGPTQAELDGAKANLIGGFSLRIDSNRKLLDNLAGMATHQLPLDYLDTWTQRVDAVTLADIRAAFARALQPDRMVTVVVGGAP